MHGLPCPSLGRCFGYPSDSNSEPALAPESDECQTYEPDPVKSQPSCQQKCQGTIGYFSTQKTNGTNSPCNPKDKADHPFCLSSSSDDEEEEFCAEMELKYSHIPRPSVILRHPKETASDRTAYRGETEDGPLSDSRDPGLSLSPGRSVMAEPDYLEGDCDQLIKPKKLINPVKNSRNHQDLHRELLMNQKRGLAPQNKPELQKVLEKRKREQVLKAQKEEQEAHKKRSDLEIELMKRQQKLEQLELEQQKNEEEQENTPEFVKMKSNLRRTKQETDGEERTT